MNTLQQWKCCPEFIDIGEKNGSVRLVKRDDLYAVRGSVSERNLEHVKVQLTGDDINILRGTPSTELASDLELLPVYAASIDSTPAVATKRVFLRLDEDATIESVRGDIEALEFFVDEIPAHAPHCAWLEPKSGRIDEALSKIELLRALPHTAHAEPQLLRPRSWKDGT
jgi:hypothetical protein